MTERNIAFEQFKAAAKQLKAEEGVDYSEKGRDVIQLMLDRYCFAKDTNDEHRKNLYISGLMLRFWYVISKLQARSPIPGLEYNDFMDWLYEAIEYACKYRAWQDPTKRVNAQQAINQCIETIRVQKYYDLNLQKNKVNQMTFSLDAEFDEDGESTLLDTLVDEDYETEREYNEGAEAAYALVQSCIDRKKIVEAIILDTIAFNDTQKVTKKVIKGVDFEGNPTKYTQTTSEFWSFRCVQILSNLPVDYASYFKKHYQVLEPELEAALAAIRAANNQKLYRYLAKTLKGARDLVQFA
jgi:hypothetical protein